MREYITVATVTNEISLLRDVYRGPVILVEGGGDSLLLKKFLHAQTPPKVVVGHGKPRVLAALEACERRGENLLLAVVDADFWHITGEKTTSMNVAITDWHDLELMMIACDSSRDVYRELCGDRADKHWDDVRSELLEEASKVGRMRLMNSRNGDCLDFKSVELASHVAPMSQHIDVTSYIEALLEVTGACASSRDDLMRAAIHDDGTSLYHLAQGHDLLFLFSQALQNGALDTLPETSVSHDLLSREFRLAYDYSAFMRTDLAQTIEAWARWNRVELLRST